jgi:twitching motility protein PilT
MTKPSHQIFKRIVLHNRLLSELEVDALLHEVDDPERAVQQLIERHVLTDKKAAQFLDVYHKQLEKFEHELESLWEESPGDAKPKPAPAAKPRPPAAGPAPVPTPAHAPPEHVAKPAPGAPPEAVTKAEPAAAPPAAVPAPAALGQPPRRPLHDPAPLPAGGAELIRRLLQEARLAEASDVHLKAGMAPILRVRTELQDLDVPPLPPDVCEAALLAILNAQQRERFLATNDLDFSYDGGPDLGRFRTNFFRHHRGMDGVFRLISNKVPTFEELHLPEQVRRFTDYRVGIVLVTGPKGCGKTTTLAAMVDRINATRAAHIITVEDPIEFVQLCKAGHVNQRQVNVHTASFSNALRSALREAPDVIMVGEMRDLETTSLAITAAETGHLVLATLHTPDAVRTIGRILDVFPPKEQPQIRAMLSESLRGICSQLLLPSADGTRLELAVEVLVNTTAIGHLIREEKMHQVRGLMQTGKQHGMILMDESLIRLARDGRIRTEDALAHAEDLKLVEKALAH